MTKIYSQGNYIVIEANNERTTFQKKGVGFEIVNDDGLYILNYKELPIGYFNYSDVKKEDGSDYATPLEFETFLFENTGNFNSGADVSPNVIGSLKITDTAPTTQGLYILSDVGTYTNLGGINALSGKLNFASFDGATWSKVEVAMQSGKSAYEVAVANGFVGTEAQWLASLKPAVLQTMGTSTTDAISQKAVTDEVNKIYNGFAQEVESLEMYERGQASLNLSATKKIGILVAGQSNTEGRVPIAQAPSYITSNDNTVPNVQMWNDGTKLFAPFKFGVNTGSGTGATTSTRYAYDAIASYLLAQNKSQTIYLIKRAVGGTAIDVEGMKGSGYWTPKTELITSGHKLIEQLKERARTALAADPTLEIKAVMWHQGESDSTATASPLYYQNLKNVIAYIRGITGNPKLPFVLGTISTASAQYNATVDAAIRKIDTEDPFVFLVDMAAGTLLDAYHFDATSTNNLGTAMFNILKDIV